MVYNHIFFSIINQSFLVIGNLPCFLTRLAIVYFSSNCYGCQTLYRSTAGIYRLSSVEYEGRIVFHWILYLNRSCNVLILCWFNAQSEENPCSTKPMYMKKTLLHGNFFIERTNKRRYWQRHEMFEGKCWLLYEIL